MYKQKTGGKSMLNQRGAAGFKIKLNYQTREHTSKEKIFNFVIPE